MKVVVIFEFPEITDLDGPDSDYVVEEITDNTTRWARKYDCNVWIDEVLGD